MRDGRTRRRPVQRRPRRTSADRPEPVRIEVCLVAVDGDARGTELELDRDRMLIGRGPSVHFAFADDEMSRQHAALERTESGVRIVDLESTNGTRVNGEPVEARDLAHGDRVTIGGHVFRVRLEKRDATPRAWRVPDG